MRKIIFHFHIFKNAGTSVDSLFKQNFGSLKWSTREFPFDKNENKELVIEWIESNPEALCFSSHTAHITRHVGHDIILLPVIFLRHPIDRIESAYAFEREQGVDTFGSVLARNTTFKGYVESYLALPHRRECRSFQARKLTLLTGCSLEEEHIYALNFIKSLPFIGLTDEFDKSLVRMEIWLRKEGFEEFAFESLAENRNQKRSGLSLCERLENIRNQLGDSLYQNLLDANSSDMYLYEAIKESYN